LKIRSISHTGLTVSSFERAVKWYYEMFGLRLIDDQFMDKEQVNKLYSLYNLKDVDIHLGFLRAPKGGVVELFEFSPSMPAVDVAWNKPGPTHFTFDVKNIPEWYRWLKAKGVEFCSEPQKTGINEWVFLKDPDGNLIELIDLKSNYPIIRLLGGLAGKFMAKGKYKKYYTENGCGR